MKLTKLIELLTKERDRLVETKLDPDAIVELAVEMGGTTRVARLQFVSRVGADIRLTARPS